MSGPIQRNVVRFEAGYIFELAAARNSYNLIQKEKTNHKMSIARRRCRAETGITINTNEKSIIHAIFVYVRLPVKRSGNTTDDKTM